MGDHAVSIAKATIHVKGETRIAEVEQEISDMAEQAKKMVDAVLTAYINQDAAKAKEIATWDDKVNASFDKIHRDAIAEMKQDPETIVSGNDYLHVATFLERIGDYVTNISEWIVYLSTGKITELSPSNDTDEA
jgi:phosphate transport system protein